MIRPAYADDLPALLRMGQEFYKIAPLNRWIAFDKESFSNTLSHMLESEQAFLAVAVDEERICGMAAALISPHWLNDSQKVAHELFWWVDPWRRGNSLGLDLHKALEDWARAAGAQVMEMGALEGLKAQALGRYYRRAHYGLMDHIYCKSL